jgi:hypothetical protein
MSSLMQIMRPTTDPGIDQDGALETDVSYAVVETDEDERIVLRGMSQDEVDAKLDDFLTWAS